MPYRYEIAITDYNGNRETFYLSSLFCYYPYLNDIPNSVWANIDYDYSKIYKSEQAYFDDLTKLSNKVKNLIGIESKIIRFPGGSSNAVSRKYNKGIMTRLTKQVQQKGYVYVDWNVDSTDASGNNISKARILSSVKNNCKGKSNICILMHDTAAKKTTVDALPEMISYLKAQGYRFDALTTSSPIFHHGLNN